jgi:phosphate transport system substrate-binding protein
MTLLRANWRAAGTLLLLSGLLATGCKQGNPADRDTPTSGRLSISVDETFEPIVRAQIDTFQKLYQSATVTAAYRPEEAVMQDLLANKVRAVIVSRQLTEAEKANFKKQTITPRVTKIATDGLAIIVHPSNPDSLLTMKQLRAIFTGQTQNWAQVSGKKGLGDINVVFDANRSSTTRYVQDSVTQGTPLTKRVFAAKSNPELLNYVATHPDAIGVVGANWISDRDDSSVQSFLRKVRVVGISALDTPKSPDDYVQPYQAYLALKTYPLRRELYVINREARTGLGSGFASFVAGTKGQLIILKSGLMPATGQTRIVTTSAK